MYSSYDCFIYLFSTEVIFTQALGKHEIMASAELWKSTSKNHHNQSSESEISNTLQSFFSSCEGISHHSLLINDSLHVTVISAMQHSSANWMTSPVLFLMEHHPPKISEKSTMCWCVSTNKVFRSRKIPFSYSENLKLGQLLYLRCRHVSTCAFIINHLIYQARWQTRKVNLSSTVQHILTFFASLEWFFRCGNKKGKQK